MQVGWLSLVNCLGFESGSWRRHPEFEKDGDDQVKPASASLRTLTEFFLCAMRISVVTVTGHHTPVSTQHIQSNLQLGSAFKRPSSTSLDMCALLRCLRT